METLDSKYKCRPSNGQSAVTEGIKWSISKR